MPFSLARSPIKTPLSMSHAGSIIGKNTPVYGGLTYKRIYAFFSLSIHCNTVPTFDRGTFSDQKSSNVISTITTIGGQPLVLDVSIFIPPKYKTFPSVSMHPVRGLGYFFPSRPDDISYQKRLLS